MELRARTRPMLRRAGLLAALTALLVPAVAGTTTASAKTRAPVVKRITPKHVYVGEKLTVRGRHFRRGVNKNTVAFKRKGARAVFVRADKATTKMLVVVLPKRLEKVLVVKNGTPTATRLRVRVMARKFGKRFSKRSRSPIVGPEKPPTPDKPVAVDPNADCDGDKLVNRNDPDDDNDLLDDKFEKDSVSKLLDTCKADTDEDGIEDGYEYRSALDLNNKAVAYPVTKPYPNPLDKTDADIDHDGDTLSLLEEYRLWKYSIKEQGWPRTLSNLSYSAGEQYSRGKLAALATDPYDKQADFNLSVQLINLDDSGPGDPLTLDDAVLGNPFDAVPDRFGATTLYNIHDMNRSGGALTLAERTYYDLDGSTFLDDAERDADADGLPNQWEASGCMTQGWWKGVYDKEAPYYLTYGSLDLADEDSDGDKVLDGADDQDSDDVPNVMECRRGLASAGLPGRTWQGFINAFNPCLPHPRSRTCKQYVGVGPGGKKWAPFEDDDTYTDYYEIKN